MESQEPNLEKPKIDIHQFDLQTLYKLKADFKEMDKEGNQTISKEEFKKYYIALNLSEEALEFNFQSIDLNNDNKLTWLEYLTFMHLNMFPSTSDEYVLKTFRGYDKDKNNEISRAEILEACQKLGTGYGEDYVNSVMAVYDIDHSGSLNYPQFYCLMKRIDIKWLTKKVDDILGEAQGGTS